MSNIKKTTLIIGGVGLAFLLTAPPVSAITSPNTAVLLRQKQNNVNKKVTIKVWSTVGQVNSGKPLFTHQTTFKGEAGKDYISEILQNKKDNIFSKKIIKSNGYDPDAQTVDLFLADPGLLDAGGSESTPYKIEIKTKKDGTKYQEVSYTPPAASPFYYYTGQNGKEVTGKTIVPEDYVTHDTYLNKKPTLFTRIPDAFLGKVTILKDNQQQVFNISRGKHFSIDSLLGNDVQVDWAQVQKQLPEGLKVVKISNGIQITGSPKKIGNYTIPVTLKLSKTNTTVKLVFNIQGNKNSWEQDAKGDWFFYKADNTLAKNQWINGTYWVGQDGKMTRNAWVDGGKYYVGADGKWVKDAHKPGWHKDAKGDWFFYKADNTLATNQWIENSYWVGQDGKMARNAWVDGGKYYVGADGKWLPNHPKKP